MTDARRRACWKQLAQDPNSPLTAAQRAEIKARGWRGPQRLNEFGELETMELSHEPIPLRDRGKEVVPRWLADHAAIDPHRQLKKRP
jgi:filamentous hemagglutinin